MEDVYPRVPRTETREVYLRDLGTTPRVETRGSTLVVTVPSIECHEVIAIDL